MRKKKKQPVIINDLSQRFEEIGFLFDHHNSDDGRYFYWTSPAFENIDYYICVQSPEFLRKTKTCICDIVIGFQSSLITDIMNDVRDWECGEFFSLPEHFPYTNTLPVVNVGLKWLGLNAQNPTPEPLEWRVEEGNHKQIGDKILADIEQYGRPFWEEVHTLERLIDLLINIRSYPKKTYAPGPLSIRPYIFAAWLLFVSGEKEKALDLLKLSLEKEIDEIRKEFARQPELGQQYETIFSCQYLRHIESMESKSMGAFLS